MAESVREVERNRNNKIRLMSENCEFLSANSEKKIEDSSVNNLQSLFYLNNVENACFSKYSVNNDGVNRASEFCPDVDGFSSDYKGICPNNDENCRKKRCSDRYDSSESSDSGIAVSSSASSGTSDITDPGSPFSTSSDDSSSSPGKCKVGKRCKSEEKSPSWSQPAGRCRSEEKTWTESWEEKQQSDKTDQNFIVSETDFKMAPNVPSASSPCDLWTSITGTNTANDTAHFNHFEKSQNKAIRNKRLNVDSKESIAPFNLNNNIVVNVPSPIISEIEPDRAESKRKCGRSDNCEGPKVKMRRASYDCVIVLNKDSLDVNPKANKNGVKGSEKSPGCVAKSKQDKSHHQGKITEYFKSQIKSLVGMKRDFGVKKDGKTKAAAPENGKTEQEPSAKKSKTGPNEKPRLDLPVFVKPSPKPIQAVMPFAEPNRLLTQLSKLPKAADFLLNKPAETKTLFNKILQNHKNRKLAESYSKSRTVLKPKPAPETEPAKPSHAPYETSTRNSVTELPNPKIEELSSKLENSKAKNIELESNLLVSKVADVARCEAISSRSDEAESSKLPILSAPKTIRFPATCHNNRMDNRRPTRESVSCRWDACSMQFDSANGLLDHLQTAHVLTQVSGEKFVCLWVGCKVYDQKSCSRTWLERHVLSHAGNKPYRCIVNGCGQGFSTQAILERHVNNHFAADVKKALDNSIVHKLFRRNGKKLRYRRQPWSARMFDFFDSGIMEGLEHRLVKLTQARTGGDVADIPGKSLALTSQVIARRMTENGRQQFLLRWFPNNIVEDEWVYEKEVTRKKMVSIPSLSPSVSTSLQETLELVTRSSRTYRTGRRKNNGTTRNKSAEEKPVESEEPATEKPTEEPEITQAPEEPILPPPKAVTAKKVKAKIKKKKVRANKGPVAEVEPPSASSLPPVDPATDASLATENSVSLKQKEEPVLAAPAPAAAAATPAALPEEMSVIPACSPEELVPVHTNGIIVDSPKLIAPMKTEMIMGGPLKLVTSQYIEQPFLQAVMPLQMPVTYQIPIVKLSQTSGMFFSQIPNYIIPPAQPAVFPSPPVPAFRNGFHFSTTDTIQIQASSTTLQQTTSAFMQSTNSSGFQIVQSPAAAAAAAAAATNIQQSVLTAFQSSGITNLNLKSPTLRLLNCQPLILNNVAKPLANVSLTLSSVSSIANPNTSALTGVPMLGVSVESKQSKMVTVAPPASVTVSPGTPQKKTSVILPKPSFGQGSSVADGAKSKKQCLQPCGPTTGAAT